VAVVVDYQDGVDDQGQPVNEPLDPERLERIRQLVRQAMGYSEARGDGLEVVNSPFAEETVASAERDWWRDPFWQGLLMAVGRWLLVGLAALLLYWLLLRPILRRYQNQRPAPAAQAAPTPVAAAPYAQPERDEEPPQAPPRRRRRRSSAHEQNLKDLQDMAQEDPAMVAMIVRSWMNRHD
jgi:flagellar M-ring protein FliF